MLLPTTAEHWFALLATLPAYQILLGLLVTGLLFFFVARKLVTTILTLRAIALMPLFSRRLANWVQARNYSYDQFVAADGASARFAEMRKQAVQRLAGYFAAECPKSIAWGDQVRGSFSDLRFTDANRVPFPFAQIMKERFNLCSVVTESNGAKLRDLDGHWTLDVSGSYGLNVAGFDRYKEWMQRGWERVKDLGPVLGPLHPVVAENIELLKQVSKLDEVSFHMSGTEAVMAAVRLARFNTRRKLIVCFSGAYHGWWDGVQPGLGSERSIDDCLALKDVHQASLDVIRWRAKEIAGVVVNPFQSFHPNSPPPSDTVLLTSGVRKTEDSTSEYARWLRDLRDLCSSAGIPLIFDEVYTGFRLAPGGAQEYFGIQADMVVYGKTVAGGMPIGVVCGKKELMRRFDPEHPMRIAYVIGTFSAHPLVMGAMNEFLNWLRQPSTPRLYEKANRECEEWARTTNAELVNNDLPLRMVNLATVWTVLFKEPGRYNWLLQYYLRAEGMTLSWVGTGRCLSSLDYTTDNYRELRTMVLAAAQKMRLDGWWLTEQQQPQREKAMRWKLVQEMAGSIVQIPQPLAAFTAEILQRKHDDHVASHSNLVNQLFHLLSSSVFIFCYFYIFVNLTEAMWLGSTALLVRQFGHAILEPPSHDKEKLLLGYTTRNKSLILAGYLLIPVIQLLRIDSWTWDATRSAFAPIAGQWFVLTLSVVLGRVAYLTWKYDFRTSMVWFIKLLTDPITDLAAYYTSLYRILSSSQATTHEPA